MPFVNNQGIKLHYQIEGKGTPLLMIHGGIASLEDWYDMGYVDQLRKSHKLILIDLRGHGKSDHPLDSSEYRYDLFMQDIMSVLDELGINQFHALGYSMGGWFVYGLANVAADRLLSMTVLDGVPSIHDGENIKQLMGNENAFNRFVGMFPESVQKRYRSVDREHYARFADALSKDVPSIIQMIESVIKRVDIPCLVVTSEYEDGSTEFTLLKKTADSIQGAKFVEKNGFSHPEIIIRSDEILPLIEGFLDYLR